MGEWEEADQLEVEGGSDERGLVGSEREREREREERTGYGGLLGHLGRV